MSNSDKQVEDPLVMKLVGLGVSPQPEDLDANGALSPPEVEKPYRALGHNHSKFYFYTLRGGQILELSARELTSPGAILQLAPLDWWSKHFPGKKGKGISPVAAADSLIEDCLAAGVFSPDRLRGRGVWIDGDRVVLHLGDRLIVDGVETSFSQFDSPFVYERAYRLDVDLGLPLSDSEACHLIDVCMSVPWADRDSMGTLLAGWIVVALICGAMPWRTHIWITSEPSGGKTWIMNRIIHPAIGPLALLVQSKSTEAGIRGKLGIDALPVIFDEAESQNVRDRERIQQVLDLARQASSEGGADILKGTQSGGVRLFRIRSSFAFSSVNLGLQQAADESRTVVLTLQPPDDSDERAEMFRLAAACCQELLTADFGPRLLTRTLELVPTIRRNFRHFADAIVRCGLSQRAGDTYGALLAGAWSLRSRHELSEGEADAIVKDQPWIKSTIVQSEREPEWKRALAFLAQQALPKQSSTGRMELVPVSELLSAALPGSSQDQDMSLNDALTALGRVGIRIQSEGDGPQVAIANTSAWINERFKDTPWGSAWRHTLLRAPGAGAVNRTMAFAGLRSKHITIPLSTILGDESPLGA